MITLDELLEKRSPENRCRIAKKVDEMKREIGLYQSREARDVSQTELTLESRLTGSPKEYFTVTDEDKEWIDINPVGKEVI
ncbi:hypothetical protein Ppb6_02648 [Photorhabdus australis subsp. thailandensis]|uniref:Uncharacterized protein n=1 Tax=Photorhabdus australis subsp. thailandensis TaxID=2805096 RepID=A0A1C0U2M3_9GAMM|nr:hypothetical protein [Photorhabdus australis]OCQ52141.1 hypothetical protein Ppb6_02648 [Photorhabdus australis subsp. thailandensis]